MTLPHRLCRAALALAVVATLSVPAGANSIGGGGTRAEPAGRAEMAGPMGRTAGGESLRAEAAPGRGRATLSVNIAIVVLGTLWLGLMVRRIQLRSTMGELRDGLRDAAPQPAAGGR